MALPQYYRLLNIPSNATQDQVRQAYKKESLRTHPDRLPAGATTKDRKIATENFQAIADAYYVLSDPARRREYDTLYRSHARSSGGRGGGFGTGTSSGKKSGTSQRADPGFNKGRGDGSVPGGFPSFSTSDFPDPEEEDLPFDASEQPGLSSFFFQKFGEFMRNATTGAGASAGGDTASEKGKGKKGPKMKMEEEEEGEEMFGDEKRRRKNGGRPDAEETFGNVFEEMLAPEVAHVRPWWSYMGGASGAVMGYIVANIPGAVAGAVAGNRLGAIRDAKGKSVAQVFNTLGSSQKAEILKGLAFKVLGSMT